jgi:hypothetical protein
VTPLFQCRNEITGESNVNVVASVPTNEAMVAKIEERPDPTLLWHIAAVIDVQIVEWQLD